MRVWPYIIWLTTLSYALWVHDWTMISMALILVLVWPMIAVDLEKQRRERLLERLWDDDGDLSNSA